MKLFYVSLRRFLMQIIEALNQIQQLDISAFSTNDAAACWKVSREYASQILSRLAKAKQLIHLKKNFWAIPSKINRFNLPEILSAPQPCYLSLQTALYLHNFIDQIPHIIYAITIGRTRKITTPLATVSFHHVDLSFFFGFEQNLKTGINMATPEKALIDFLYLSPAKSNFFCALPELDISENFSIAVARKIIQKIPFKNRRNLVVNRFEKLLKL